MHIFFVYAIHLCEKMCIDTYIYAFEYRHTSLNIDLSSAYKCTIVILVTSRELITLWKAHFDIEKMKRLHYLSRWIYKTSNRSRTRNNPTTLWFFVESVSRMTLARALQCMCFTRGWTASPADIHCKPGEQVHAYFAGEIEQGDVFGLREPCNPSMHDCWFDAEVKDRGVNVQVKFSFFEKVLCRFEIKV